MFEDIADLVMDSDFAQEVTLLRPSSAGVAANGEATDVTYTASTITATAQPQATDITLQKPEGQRLDNKIVVWSPVPLYGTDGSRRLPDHLIVDGVRYVVAEQVNFGSKGYWQVIAEGYVTDPNFAGQITLMRPTQVGQTVTWASSTISASVQQSATDAAELSVRSQVQLRIAGTGQLADHLVVDGIRYVVTALVADTGAGYLVTAEVYVGG